jgi:3-oxoacyl-[acyl-carrier-protein] synthase II
MDRYAQYAMVSSDEVKDANFNFEKLDKDRAGVIWGVRNNRRLETFQIEVLNFAGDVSILFLSQK